MTRRIHAVHEPFRIDMGDGDWVEIKDHLTMGDRSAINGAIASGGFRAGQKEIGKLQLGQVNLVTLQRAILGWGGPGFCVIDHDASHIEHDERGEDSRCRPIPVTPEAIADMDDAAGRKILDVIEERNPQPKGRGDEDGEEDATP